MEDEVPQGCRNSIYISVCFFKSDQLLNQFIKVEIQSQFPVKWDTRSRMSSSFPTTSSLEIFRNRGPGITPNHVPSSVSPHLWDLRPSLSSHFWPGRFWLFLSPSHSDVFCEENSDSKKQKIPCSGLKVHRISFNTVSNWNWYPIPQGIFQLEIWNIFHRNKSYFPTLVQRHRAV